MIKIHWTLAKIPNWKIESQDSNQANTKNDSRVGMIFWSVQFTYDFALCQGDWTLIGAQDNSEFTVLHT